MAILTQLTIREYILRFQQDLLHASKIVLYGAGADGKQMQKALHEQNIFVSFFCDRDPKKNGCCINDVEVLSPSRLVEQGGNFHLVLCISSDLFSQESILEGIEQDVFEKMAVPTAERNVFLLTHTPTRKVLYFESQTQFWEADHWYLPAAYDRVEEYSSEYAKEVRQMNLSFTWENGHLSVSDLESKYYNYKNGMRFTPGSDLPGTRDRTFFFIGDSRCYGYPVEDRHTISSFLQDIVGVSCAVVNFGAGMFTLESYLYRLYDLPLKPGDVVTFSATLSFASSEKNFLKEKATALYAFYLKKMQEHCNKLKCSFVFYYIPTVNEIGNPSLAEQYIAALSIAPTLPPSHPHHSSCPQFSYAKIRQSSKFSPVDRTLLFEILQAQRICAIDLTDYFTRPHSFGEVFIDKIHLSPNGYAAVAQRLYRLICNMEINFNDLKNDQYQHESAMRQMMCSMYESDELDQYMEYLRQNQRPNTVRAGCIVMNCNPFTNGHRYLIEYAAKQVEVLYIFVLQEDLSDFPFTERIALVREGTADLENVVVLESGRFLISSITLPEYFNKDAAPSNVDCTTDLTLFCTKIAPALQISIRFAGEEPYCKVTRQYNAQMQKLLPEYGIEFREIKRLGQGGDPISASRVRALLKQNRLEDLRPLVPDVTYQYLRNRQD